MPNTNTANWLPYFIAILLSLIALVEGYHLGQRDRLEGGNPVVNAEVQHLINETDSTENRLKQLKKEYSDIEALTNSPNGRSGELAKAKIDAGFLLEIERLRNIKFDPSVKILHIRIMALLDQTAAYRKSYLLALDNTGDNRKILEENRKLGEEVRSLRLSSNISQAMRPIPAGADKQVNNREPLLLLKIEYEKAICKKEKADIYRENQPALARSLYEDAIKEFESIYGNTNDAQLQRTCKTKLSEINTILKL